MTEKAKGAGTNKTRRDIIKLLKTEGAMNSTQLAQRLGLTAMGVRQHLYALQAQKLVAAEERPVPLGRPAKFWQLTKEADRLFPDAYAEMSLSLMDAVADTFGAAGLRRIIAARGQRQQAAYAAKMTPAMSVKEKLRQLARLRTEEG